MYIGCSLCCHFKNVLLAVQRRSGNLINNNNHSFKSLMQKFHIFAGYCKITDITKLRYFVDLYDRVMDCSRKYWIAEDLGNDNGYQGYSCVWVIYHWCVMIVNVCFIAENIQFRLIGNWYSDKGHQLLHINWLKCDAEWILFVSTNLPSLSKCGYKRWPQRRIGLHWLGREWNELLQNASNEYQILVDIKKN